MFSVAIDSETAAGSRTEEGRAGDGNVKLQSLGREVLQGGRVLHFASLLICVPFVIETVRWLLFSFVR